MAQAMFGESPVDLKDSCTDRDPYARSWASYINLRSWKGLPTPTANNASSPDTHSLSLPLDIRSRYCRKLSLYNRLHTRCIDLHHRAQLSTCSAHLYNGQSINRIYLSNLHDETPISIFSSLCMLDKLHNPFYSLLGALVGRL